MSINKAKIPYNAELATKTLSVSDEAGFNGQVTLGGTIKIVGNMTVDHTSGGSMTLSDGTMTKVGVPSITTIYPTFGNFTLNSPDLRDSLIEMNLTVPNTVTIPADSPALTFPVGTTIDILQTNSGQTTIVAGNGVVVTGTPGLKIRTQWSIVTILKRNANTWVVFGDLTT
jgi:hypothetical protein